MFGWIFFRANTVSDAIYVATHCWQPGTFSLTEVAAAGLARFEFVLALVMIAVVFVADLWMAHPPEFVRRSWERPTIRWTCYYACFWSIIFFGVFQRLDFIYFQF
jgi:alginate O-acetyltransferase complex protein AlgI